MHLVLWLPEGNFIECFLTHASSKQEDATPVKSKFDAHALFEIKLWLSQVYAQKHGSNIMSDNLSRCPLGNSSVGSDRARYGLVRWL